MALDQYTVSLLHFDDGLKDEAGKIWTATNGASVSTAQSKFGGSSLYLDGSQYISTGVSDDFNFEAGDFTIDWWQYVTNIGNTTVSFQTANGYELLLNYDASTGGVPFLFYASSAGNSVWDVASGVKMGTIQRAKWVHQAVCRQGNSIYLFENGVLQNKVNVDNKSFAPVTNVHIGRYIGPVFQGYIDEFRISKGIARWTSDFTPPTAPYDGGIPPLPAPTNLTANAGNAEVTLNWNAVTGATGYNVKRATVTGGPYTTIASNVLGTSYVDSNVTNGITYHYVVTAITADGESANSNESSATPTAPLDPELRIILEVGEQIQLIGNTLPEKLGDPNLEWNSTLPNIASVDVTGKVTANTEGLTRIQVKTIDGTWTDYALVEVVAQSDQYRLSILLTVGDSCLLKFTADADVIWQSGNLAVAAVNPSNAPVTRVTAHDEGLSLITVQTADGSKQGQIYVTVIK